MNYIDMILDNIQARFDPEDLDGFGIEKLGDNNLEVTTPNGAFLYVTDTERNFLSIRTTHIDNPYRWTFGAHNLGTSEATNILVGFIAANL